MPFSPIQHDSDSLPIPAFETLLRHIVSHDRAVAWSREGETRVLPCALVRAHLDLFDDYKKASGRNPEMPPDVREFYWDQTLSVDEHEKLTEQSSEASPAAEADSK